MIRRALLLAGVAAMMPVGLAANLAQAAPNAAHPRFVPPSDPLVLTRTLVRTLRDGKQIVVRRSYAVRFSKAGDGFVLEGHQIDASVDAPAKLASLAEIERSRVDDGMFPIQLDAAGQIAASQGAPTGGNTANTAAFTQARVLVDQSSLPPSAKREAQQQVSQIGATSSDGSLWPTDLFSPAATDRTERRHIALPGGGEGEVEVAIRIQGKIPGGLPAQVERTVTTVIDGDSRISREVWTLGPAEGMF